MDRTAAPERRIRFLGAFESTYLPAHDVDVTELTGHASRWRSDLDALLGSGVTALRYPLRWHRIEPEPGRFDWSSADPVMEHLRERGAEPILDLIHHTSYPAWISDGFRDRRFRPAYLRYAEAVARRYPWVPGYCLFNEPFATLFLAGHEALWPPYDHGDEGLVRLMSSVLPAVSEAAAVWRELLPGADHVWIDTAEHHVGTPGPPSEVADIANDRRFVTLDLMLGHDLDERRPYLRRIVEAGGEHLLGIPPLTVDRLGLDYYAHSEWWYEDGRGISPSPHPVGFAAVAEQYGERYHLPMLLSETNLRGLPSDRVSWLRYMLEQVEIATERGVDLDGFCWFPYLDSADWDSLLSRPAGRTDPVGVVSLGPNGERIRTAFTDAWEAAAAGSPAADLPAFRFQPPNDALIPGVQSTAPSWPWRDPEEDDMAIPDPTDGQQTEPDLVVLSHLRWTFVWQRPQHLVSRFAEARARSGARTWFVEEPLVGEVDEPVLRQEQHGHVTRLVLVVPLRMAQPTHRGFALPGTEDYGQQIRNLLARAGRPGAPDVLLYTPMALDHARTLDPGRLFYDVMDDLASFRNAPKGLRSRQQDLLGTADVVFTGGLSLHRTIAAQRRHDCHLFASGVDVQHYAGSRAKRTESDGRERPVAGYVGVLDERLDLELIDELAEALPDWTLRLVGPTAKIEATSLPSGPNIEYGGLARYEDLPQIMAGFDVALMPFALNQATRSISPTKTLEYLAAGLPVVSTRVPDVVAEYSDVVHFADDAQGFADACRVVIEDLTADRDTLVRPIAAEKSWDVIAERMDALMRASGMGRREQSGLLVGDLERAQGRAAGAAAAGMADAALGDLRHRGEGIEALATAAVASATPFLRAPLLARLSAAALLHPGGGDGAGRCPTCGVEAPCATALALGFEPVPSSSAEDPLRHADHNM
jgi:beta-glucosidase/6-phospho-beta-glucosidase/beta-galactosidase/glycosyltransferase involved in cell wall biosynthesis